MRLHRESASRQGLHEAYKYHKLIYPPNHLTISHYHHRSLFSFPFFFLFCLLEDLTVSKLVLLAVDGDALLPAPGVLNELSVLSLGGVELSELVALPVRGDIESGDVLLATDDESTLDNGVVVLAVDGSTSEDVLAGTLKTVVEAANQVVGHEGEGELIVVLVVNLPERPLLEVEVIPEELHGLVVVLDVGVLALPLIERERGAAESLKRVLGLGGSRSLIRSGGSSGGSGRGGLLLGLLLGLLRLLGGSVGQSNGLEELDLLSNLGEDGLAADSVEPSGDSRVLLAPLLVEEVLEATGGNASSEEIGEGDALADKEGVLDEMLLNNSEVLLGNLDGLVDVLLVVGRVALEGAEPSNEGGEDLRVEEGHPLQDGSIVLLGLAEKSGLLVLGSDCIGVSEVPDKLAR